MPIIFTFDLHSKHLKDNDYPRLKSMFEQFGWQSLGGTAYRYPSLRADKKSPEDWLNNVVPALMLFRAYTNHIPKALKSFTLDVQSSTGYNLVSHLSCKPLKGDQINLIEIKGKKTEHFGTKQLKSWLNSIKWPYTKKSDDQ